MSSNSHNTEDPVYTAVALQVAVKGVSRCSDKASAREVMASQLDHFAERISGYKQFGGTDLKLVVLPEYCLTSFPQGESIPLWADKAALDMDGPEYERFSMMASDNGVYLAGNVYEKDPHFPDLYFQTCFLIDPTGDVILRYRRLNSMYAPTPHDVWEKYLDIFGLDGVFPIAKTDIGNLAPIASEEIFYPEIARCFAMRGAEVFFHPTSEGGSPVQSNRDVCKLARAIENVAYVISANTGGLLDIDLPEGSANGCSKIVDYRGKVLTEAGWGETGVMAEIDIAALRRERRRPGMNNYLSRQRFEAFTESYALAESYPANLLLDEEGDVKIPDRAHFQMSQREVIARLDKLGII